MVDPTTSNILLAVPTRGSDPGTWDVPVNNNSNAIDGYFGGVQSISVSNAPVTLTSPAGTVTAGGGPTQAQNAVLRFTGVLTSNVQVTLPLPGYYIIENLSTGNFVLSFRGVGLGEVIGIQQGTIQHIYNDATNVRFVNLGAIGRTEMWTGIIAMPAWVTACSKPPYLLNDGTIYTFAAYPYLGAQLQGAFGGNGITTFGVPDHRGRVILPYDGTGLRITAGGCGINGQTIGAAADNQSITLGLGQIPSHNHGVNDPGHVHNIQMIASASNNPFPAAGSTGAEPDATTRSAVTNITIQNSGGGGAHPNVQPSIVTGISVIRAA